MPFVIVLDPAGDNSPGRLISTAYERGIALQFVQALKIALENQIPNLTVAITRHPGQTITPLHAANFSNRLSANLFLSFHFFQEQEPKPRLFAYTFNCSQSTIYKPHQLQLIPYDQAHCINHVTTTAWGMCIKEELSTYERLFDVHGVYQLPCKPLIGIVAPAFLFDIGSTKPDDWSLFIDPIIHCIQRCITRSLI
jgi:hypothetical protein